ncbi:MAG: hypothetical protein IH599_07490 [Bacteroidales bacterium]|nr:hypothetical protein [Bacteroidales bacterium]
MSKLLCFVLSKYSLACSIGLKDRFSRMILADSDQYDTGRQTPPDRFQLLGNIHQK